MIKVGLTGNIGSGKTTVAQIFEVLKVPVFNADMAAHSLFEKDYFKLQLTSLFGNRIIDPGGNINRNDIASIVFSNKKLLTQLNNLVHPEVFTLFKEWLKPLTNEKYIILEAAILFESGFNKYVDEVILVKTPEEIRIIRVMKRDNTSRDEVLERVKNQMPESKKEIYANYILNNDGSQLILPQLLKIHHELLKK